MTRREWCAGCGSHYLDPVLDLGKTPLADAFPATADTPEVYYPLVVLACDWCGLVQLADVVPDDLLYGQDFAFQASASPALVAYHERYARWLLGRFPLRARRLTVEVACNDGSLLTHLEQVGCRTIGVDPAAEAIAVAATRGLTVVPEPFTLRLARELRDTHGPAGLVVANNVLAHVADLHDMVAGIAALMADDGVAVVEFQYLGDLLAGNQWDHVYHEHRFYLSITALAPILTRAGLAIVDVLRTPMQGGSVRLTLSRGRTAAQLPDEAGLPAMLQGLQSRVDYCARRLADLVRDQFGVCALYGATAKSCTLLGYAGLTSDDLQYAVDTTPGKIGRVTPGAHIPVVAPGEQPAPDVYLLAAWNYLGSVLARERDFCDRGGQFILPVPLPVIL